ncbi:MAG: 4-hydroxy-3-methylbut-2-enyl diphosphate reductase [Oscillospiraceae bacterium]|nr:4-hydroxy-3-methylbut-2-enyl diphosphate reductase [Oscillospiraceae bacterium]
MKQSLKITVAKSAGFCSGVRRAFEIATSAASKHGKAFTLGELVHNDDAVRILRERGCYAIESLSDTTLSPDGVVVIRSHGVGRAVYDELKTSRRVFYDATCPYVKRIHDIVSEHSGNPHTHIVIIGDGQHPEVQGIIGHITGEYSVVSSLDELELLISDFMAKKIGKSLIFVSQTTFDKEKWNLCIEFLKKRLTSLFIRDTIKERGLIYQLEYCHEKCVQQMNQANTCICLHIVYNTICSATVKRQDEARALSKQMAEQNGIMLVIGCKKSSNSVKLNRICAENCDNTFFIENAQELADAQRLIGVKRQNVALNSTSVTRVNRPTGYANYTASPLQIAITAGASVPVKIIEEVHVKMNEKTMEIKNENAEMDYSEPGFDFEAELNKSFPQKLYHGKRVTATVVSVHPNEVVVDVGAKQSGYIPADEIGGELGASIEETVKPGDLIDCIVTKVNDAEGFVMLSRKSVVSEAGFQKLSDALNADEILEGYVQSIVNSGVIVLCEGARIFVPASQSGVPRSGKLESLHKKTVKFKMLEADPNRRKLVGSIRAASRFENDKAKKKFWEEVEIGKSYTGEVKSIESYGVFVDLGGVDGMVHLTELSWKRIKHPSEVISLGDVLKVVIKDFDLEKRRVSLSAKDPNENPWIKFMADYPVGSTAKATIVNIATFGAFAQISPGVDGLIHISQISKERVKSVSEALKLGQEVDVKILEADESKNRVSISIRALMEEAEAEAATNAEVAIAE